MKCSVCGFENPEEKKFCQNCGKNLQDERNNKYYYEKHFQSGEDDYQAKDNLSRRSRLAENRRLRSMMRKKQRAAKRSRALSVLLVIMIIAVLINTVYISVKRHELTIKSGSVSIMQDGGDKQ